MLEVGKCYTTIAGYTVGPLRKSGLDDFCFRWGDVWFTKEGVAEGEGYGDRMPEWDIDLNPEPLKTEDFV